MDQNQIKKLLDCCFVAKKITESMKMLPAGMKPRHIHVIDCIFTLNKKCKEVRVSDVSTMLNTTPPSITKLINELEEKEIVEKYSQNNDRRVTLLKLTILGEQYYDQYVASYHSEWVEKLQDVNDEQVEIVVEVINKLQLAMPKGD